MPYFAAAMTRNGRIGLVVAAIVVAVLGFVIARPGDDDRGGRAAPTTQQPDAAGAPRPAVSRSRIRGGEAVGGAANITVTTGEVVRIVVAVDAPDDIHLHGYDIEKQAVPGRPARFRVKADVEGSFEMESHAAEDAGRDPLVARLNVEPR